MAQLLVHMDPALKRRLKARLAQEGRTFRAWVEDMARKYLGSGSAEPPRTERAPRSASSSARSATAAPAARAPEQPTYNPEED